MGSGSRVGRVRLSRLSGAALLTIAGGAAMVAAVSALMLRAPRDALWPALLILDGGLLLTQAGIVSLPRSLGSGGTLGGAVSGAAVIAPVLIVLGVVTGVVVGWSEAWFVVVVGSL